MILVAGATGSLGSRIAHELLERGDTVRVLARATSNYQPLEQKGAQISIGDLKDPASLDRACAGVDVIISTASTTKRNDDTIENVDLNGNRNLIEAAEHAGVQHFVFISTNNATLGSPVPAFHAKAATEERLRASRMTHTVLRPDGFMDIWFGMLIEAALFSDQPVTLVGEARRSHSFIAEQDVAAFALAAVRNPTARNATFDVGGPQAVTFRDVVAAYAMAFGRKIPVRFVAPGQPIPGLPEGVWGLAAALESYDSAVPMEERCRQFDIQLTSVPMFARARAEALRLSAH